MTTPDEFKGQLSGAINAQDNKLVTLEDLYSQEELVQTQLNELFKGQNFNEDQKSSLEQALHDLSDIETVKLTIAFEPQRQFLEHLHAQLSQIIKTRFVIDYAVNSKILGGMIIEYEGKYKDFSVRKKVNKYFLS